VLVGCATCTAGLAPAALALPLPSVTDAWTYVSAICYCTVTLTGKSISGIVLRIKLVGQSAHVIVILTEVWALSCRALTSKSWGGRVLQQ
jgi:hypothetical protein